MLILKDSDGMLKSTGSDDYKGDDKSDRYVDTVDCQNHFLKIIQVHRDYLKLFPINGVF